MIVKKPYAFLIKRFRTIHIILFALMIYIFITSTRLLSFFSEYASGYSKSIEYVITYISFFTFLAVFIIISISAIIYYLMSVKNKSNKTYFYMCSFYILLFIYFIIMLSNINDLKNTTFNYEQVRLLRDFSILFLIPQLILSIIVLGTALGFNIKKFEFNKDMKELEITDEDAAEVEISFQGEGYKYKRFIRKISRLFKYFITENRLFLTLISSIVAIVITFIIFLNTKVFNVKYKQNNNFAINGIRYTVKDAFITDKDIYGKVILKDKNFVLVKVNAENLLDTSKNINKSTFRLDNKTSLIIPSLTYKNEFVDVGKMFSETTISPKDVVEFVLAFIIDKKDNNKLSLKIRNSNYSSFGDISSEYVNVELNPKNMNTEADKGEYNIPIKLDLTDSILNNISVNISEYEINKSFKETINNCQKDVCSKYTYVVKPNNSNNAVLKLKTNIIVNDNSYINDYMKNASNFYDYYTKVIYRYEGNNKQVKVKKINNNYDNNEYVYIEVPNEVRNASKIKLLLDIRGIKYNILLK